MARAWSVFAMITEPLRFRVLGKLCLSWQLDHRRGGLEVEVPDRAAAHVVYVQAVHSKPSPPLHEHLGSRVLVGRVARARLRASTSCIGGL
jgi:hypothetical protein